MNAEIQTIPSYKESLKLLREQLSGMLPAEKLAIFDTDATNLGKQIGRASCRERVSPYV